MNQFVRKIDKVTGLPKTSTNGHVVLDGSVTVVSINTSEESMQVNSNGKRFAVATVDYVAKGGEIKRCGAAIYEANLKHRVPQPGDEVIATVVIAPNKDGVMTPFMQISHLIANAGYADVSDFDLEEPQESAAQQVLKGVVNN